MPTQKKAIFNWSSGKDSALALMEVIEQNEYDIHCLFTSINKEAQRVSMHGVRKELLEEQALSLGISLQILALPETPSMEDYDHYMSRKMNEFVSEKVAYSIFGDINLEDLRQYREHQLASVGLKAVFPLWRRPTANIIKDFIDKGFKAVVTCVSDKYLDASFTGRVIDKSFLSDLPKEVDPCGENGEFHSFVFDGPMFKFPIAYKLGEVVHKVYDSGKEKKSHDTGFYFRDLIKIN